MPQLIKKTDLPDINTLALSALPYDELLSTCRNLRFTTNHLYEQANQNSNNSSQPPSSDKPWDKKPKDKEGNQAASSDLTGDKKKENSLNASPHTNSPHKNRADQRQPRSQGYGRQQKLPVTRVIAIKPPCCSSPSCGQPFHDDGCKRYHAFDQIDLAKDEGKDGGEYYHVVVTRYELYEAPCESCHGCTRATLGQSKTDIKHIVMSHKRLIGPTLASIIIMLHKENGISIRKIARTLKKLYGVRLSTGAICTAINEGGLCCESQVDAYRTEAAQADLGYMDETSWRDGRETLWLWVFVTANLCLFSIGRRTRKMAEAFLRKSGFSGWLMSDGYVAYRHYQKRFRCWAHLFRKAKGLFESDLSDVSAFGLRLLELMNACKEGIYTVREEKTIVSIAKDFESTLAEIKHLCEQHKNSEHDKTKALAVEFLNDWAAIFRILDYPDYPLTNNEAERALRHWVILRKILLGTQSEVGQRATCALASVIATSKRRKEGFVESIKQCITKAKGVLENVVYRPLRLSG